MDSDKRRRRLHPGRDKATGSLGNWLGMEGGVRKGKRKGTWKEKGKEVVCISCLLALAVTTEAQQSQPTIIQDPSITTFNLSSSSSTFFRLASTASTSSPTYITLSICSPPQAVLSSSQTNTLSQVLTSTEFLFVSNSSSLTNPSPSNLPSDPSLVSLAYGGLATVTLPKPRPNSQPEGIWIGVTTPALTGTTQQWSFELAVSSSTQLNSINQQPLFTFSDSDSSTALLTSSSIFAPSSPPILQPIIFTTPSTTPSPFTLLSNSSCFLLNSPTLLSAPQPKFNATLTGRDIPPEIVNGREVKSGREGDRVRMQVEIVGLNKGTNYTVLAVSEGDQIAGTQVRPKTVGAISWFATKRGTNCRLIHSFGLCPQLAHSVPSPPSLPTDSLLSIYTSVLNPSLLGFNLTLSTFPCSSYNETLLPSANSTTVPTEDGSGNLTVYDQPLGIRPRDPYEEQFGMYSFVRSCQDCRTSYRDWLCTVVMPRCTDLPDGTDTASLQSPDNTTFPLIPADTQTTIIRSVPALSRTPFLDPQTLLNAVKNASDPLYPSLPSNSTLQSLSGTFPYAEVPPCSPLCDLVSAACPPLINWACPLPGITAEAGYGDLKWVGADAEDGRRTTVLGDLETQIGFGGGGGTGGGSGSGGGGYRPNDRFGNWFCEDGGRASEFIVRGHGVSRFGYGSGLGTSKVMLAVVAAAGLHWIA